MCQQLLPVALYSWNMNKTSHSRSSVWSPCPQMGKQFGETGTFGTWASLGTRGLWRCHVSALVLAFLPRATMEHPHAPSDITSAIPTAMWSLSSWTEKLWNYETKKKQNLFLSHCFCQTFCHSDEVTASFTVHIPRGLSLGVAGDASPQHWPW